MSKKIIDFGAKPNAVKIPTIPVNEVATELGLTIPMFYRVFYPTLSSSFNKLFSSLPSTITIPTWCSDLEIKIGVSVKNYYTCDWHNHQIPWRSYKEIKRRWELFDKVKKNAILEYDKFIKELFPDLIRKYFTSEKRSKLLPYVGLTMTFYGELGFIDEIDRYITSRDYETKLYRIRIYNVRDDLKPTEKNIYAKHVNINQQSLDHIALFDPKPRDTIKFTADVCRYNNTHETNRCGLKDIRILRIWRAD